MKRKLSPWCKAVKIAMIQKDWGVADLAQAVKMTKAWSATPGEMYKKTVLRRLCKLIDLDFNSQQRLAYEDAGDFDKEKADEPVADDTVNVFDAEFKEVEPENKDAAIIEEMGLEEA